MTRHGAPPPPHGGRATGGLDTSSSAVAARGPSVKRARLSFIKGPENRALTYVYKLKATMQRISVALRRTTSRALMELERRAKAYPSVALAAAPQP